MDLLLAVMLGIVQATLAILGGWVSLKPLSDKQRGRFVWAFIGLAIVGLSLSSWQAARTTRNNDDSTRNALGDADHPPSVSEISLPGVTRFLVSNNSNYPAYGIRIRFVDDTNPAKPIVLRNYNYPEIPAHAALLDDEVWNPPDLATQRHFFADITSRTGVYREELVMRQNGNNQWMRALRVMQGMRKLDEDIDSSWPRERNGEMSWGRFGH